MALAGERGATTSPDCYLLPDFFLVFLHDFIFIFLYEFMFVFLIRNWTLFVFDATLVVSSVIFIDNFELIGVDKM